MTGTEYLLAGGWIVWCILHSLLISRKVSGFLQTLLGPFRFHYRLLYNLTAFLTLLPMMALTAAGRGEAVFSWRGPLVVVQLLMLVLALWLFRDGAKRYDFGYLTGVRQIREQQQHALLAAGGQLSRDGSLGMIRHPWYLGSLLFLWSMLPVYHPSSVIAAGVLSVYLIVGAWLEEKKLVGEYGEQYRRYQREVSMLIPVKWLRKHLGMEGRKELSEQLVSAWARLRGWYPVTMGGRVYRCDPDHLVFWKKVTGGSWEPQTFSAFDRLLTPATVYCDIGAWIGPTVLYAAHRCRRVFCLEPDRTAYRYLLQNLQLNKLENVLPFNVALAVQGGLCRMASPRGKHGDSMTSLLLPEGAGSMEVLCLGWQNWLELVGMPVFDVIKIDIEGGEFALLPAMSAYLRAHKPKLYLSLHPHLLPEEEREAALATAVAALKMYGSCFDADNKRLALSALLVEPRAQCPATYLLLPE